VEKRIPIEPQSATYDIEKEAAAMAQLYGVLDGAKRKEESKVEKSKCGKQAIPMPPKEKIEELYLERGLTLHYAAKELGASSATLIKWMDKYGIPRRDGGRAKEEKAVETARVIEEVTATQLQDEIVPGPEYPIEDEAVLDSLYITCGRASVGVFRDKYEIDTEEYSREDAQNLLKALTKALAVDIDKINL